MCPHSVFAPRAEARAAGTESSLRFLPRWWGRVRPRRAEAVGPGRVLGEVPAPDDLLQICSHTHAHTQKCLPASLPPSLPSLPLPPFARAAPLTAPWVGGWAAQLALTSGARPSARASRSRGLCAPTGLPLDAGSITPRRLATAHAAAVENLEGTGWPSASQEARVSPGAVLLAAASVQPPGTVRLGRLFSSALLFVFCRQAGLHELPSISRFQEMEILSWSFTFPQVCVCACMLISASGSPCARVRGGCCVSGHVLSCTSSE